MHDDLASSFGPDTMPIDEDGWWARERRHFLVETVARQAQTGRHLDVGCGRGTVPAGLAETGRTTVALDAHYFADWKATDGVLYVVASADQLPFRQSVFESTSAFDLIEHFDDDGPVLTELRRVTTDDGVALITVPAFAALWGTHDERVGHRRRYVRRSLSQRLSYTGFRTAWASYFFSFLVPPAWALRRHPTRIKADRGRLAQALDPIVSMLCAAERRLLRIVRLPIGTSLLAVARPVGPANSDARLPTTQSV
jgi:SAM-dependent methyltransferase